MEAKVELEKRLKKIADIVEEIKDAIGEEIDVEVAEKVEKEIEEISIEECGQLMGDTETWSRHVGDLILELVANVPDQNLRPTLRKFAEELKNPRMERAALDQIIALA